MTGLRPAEPPYAALGRRGQILLEQGRPSEAIAVFEAALADPGEGGYARALLLERLARARLLAAEPGPALECLREALEILGRLAPEYRVRRLRATVRSGLGDAYRAVGQTEEARRSYGAAVEIARELQDPRAEGVDQARLAALALAEGDPAEAVRRYHDSLAALRRLREPAVEAAACHQLARAHRRLGDWVAAEHHYREALRLRESGGEAAAADRIRGELVELCDEAGRPEEAERWCRRAVEGLEQRGPSLDLAERLLALARRLSATAGELDEARRTAARALAVAQQADPLAPQAWAAYGLLGELNDARPDLRELARRAPEIVRALSRHGAASGLARAVLTGRVGRCFAAGARPDLARIWLREAIGEAERLPPSDTAAELLTMLGAELRRVGGESRASSVPDDASDHAAAVADGAGGAVTVLERVDTDYAFEPNLLLDGPRQERAGAPAGPLPALEPALRPMLVPGTRTWLDPEGRIRVAPPAGEPEVEDTDGCAVLRRTTRDIAVHRDQALAWHVLAAMDGRATWGAIVGGLPESDRDRAAHLVAALAAAGAVDLSGRALGRFLHWATRKGVAPAGGLEGEEAIRLAATPDAPSAPVRGRVSLDGVVPEPLRPFHALTRARRSIRDYRGEPLRREEVDAVLAAACGVTGALAWPGGEVKLRAYPSSGALYAVGIYPVAFRVDGLDLAVHRYDAEAHAVDLLAPTALERWVAAALPMERAMVAGLSLLICLTGRFDRHERKYGEGGYRMLVAEAGHLSQNIVLAATALGLAARPFGGVFDRLVNRALELDEAREQFLLAVAVGR